MRSLNFSWWWVSRWTMQNWCHFLSHLMFTHRPKSGNWFKNSWVQVENELEFLTLWLAIGSWYSYGPYEYPYSTGCSDGTLTLTLILTLHWSEWTVHATVNSDSETYLHYCIPFEKSMQQTNTVYKSTYHHYQDFCNAPITVTKWTQALHVLW